MAVLCITFLKNTCDYYRATQLFCNLKYKQFTALARKSL
ncbi:hypothetical protein RINTHH_6170 [Richelia intracellularis HH01]|uniref:Uncharacterized protein n=1 Tax=Richelia intracellularis HH01 TaxID=1165094 RepID=M1WYC1_9NOST|nr:hypothetical protein RINTHH_6170 [Richelia intracellularis HH01]